MSMDRYAAAEGFYKLAIAFAPVPDLHIMWLLHLCDAHQEMQSWAEAAQCAVAVAGVVMQVPLCLWFLGVTLVYQNVPIPRIGLMVVNSKASNIYSNPCVALDLKGK